MKKQETPIVIRDNEDLQNIIIQVNSKQGKTTVLSNFSAWENLALIMEGLELTAQKCVDEGIPKKDVNEKVANYLTKTLEGYHILD